MSDHLWDAPDLTPFSTGVMKCRRCKAETNNALLASIYPCIPKGADVDQEKPKPDKARDHKPKPWPMCIGGCGRLAGSNGMGLPGVYCEDGHHGSPCWVKAQLKMHKDNAMDTEPTPMEWHSLDQSKDESAQAMILRQRRLMRREYSRTFEHVHPLPPPEPSPEPITFAPRSEDDAQAEQLAKRDPIKDSFWHGVTVGAVVVLVAVLGLTGLLLWVSK